MSNTNRVVIESSGGVIRSVYTNDPTLEVVVIDWDEVEDGEPPARRYPTSTLSDMQADTMVAASAVATLR
jgi:hypothetical protein